jgi:hypothetical protein
MRLVHCAAVTLLVGCGGDEFQGGNSGGSSAAGGGAATGGGSGGNSSGGVGAQAGAAGAPTGGSGGSGGAAGGDGGKGGTAATGGSAGTPPKTVFVTAESYPGNFAEGYPSPIARATQLCKLSAQGAGELGSKNWHPWLSTGLTPAIAGLSGVTGPWLRVDGALVFDSVEQIKAGLPNNPIDRDANNNQLSGLVWTGTAYELNTNAVHCAAWSSAALYGLAGKAEASDKSWTDHTIETCGANYRLYCFEK